MKLAPEIFKAYDIRGIYGEEFDAEGAGRIAEAFVAFLSPKTIVLGRDARPSSAAITNTVRQALIQSGIEVLDIGLATTPLYYFAINHLNADGGIMVTASHNPSWFNGLKLCREKALAIGAGSGMEEIRHFAQKEKFPTNRQPRGAMKKVNVLESYLTLLEEEIRFAQPLVVTIDAGNGMASLVLESLLPRIPKLTVRKLYFEIDETFPNHLANPALQETLEDLRQTLRETPAHLGIAFDADVDRVGFLTRNGAPVRGDFITALLAQQSLVRDPGSKILYEVRSSRIVPEKIREAGGEPILVKPGHANINRAMRERDAVFGGELSGHYFFRDFFYRDDAIFAMLRVLQIVSEEASLEELLTPFQKYTQSGEINFRVAEKGAAMQRVEENFSTGRVTKLDGLTVEYDDWWFNLRPSNTEDLLRLNIEANDRETLKEKQRMLEKLIRQ